MDISLQLNPSISEPEEILRVIKFNTIILLMRKETEKSPGILPKVIEDTEQNPLVPCKYLVNRQICFSNFPVSMNANILYIISENIKTHALF